MEAVLVLLHTEADGALPTAALEAVAAGARVSVELGAAGFAVGAIGHTLQPTVDHLSACGEYHGPWWSSKVNALDYFGHWKPFDALCDAAFYGRNRDVALGNTPAQRFMGRWSDGVPVKELVVTEHLK